MYTKRASSTDRERLTAWVPASLKQQVHLHCAASRTSLSATVEAALRAYLGLPPPPTVSP